MTSPAAARQPNWLLRAIEPLLFSPIGRTASALLLATATLWLGLQAAQIRPESGFEKNIPLDHTYMRVLRQYQHEFGGANTVLIALIRKSGDIYEAGFLQRLRSATTEVTFTPGIDRTRVASLFTRNIMFIEVDEEGFSGDNVVPPDFQPTPETLEMIRANVGKAGIVGRLVSTDHRGAMISAELLDRDPATGAAIDPVAVSRLLEDQVRGRFTSPTRYVYRARRDQGGLKAGDIAALRFTAPRLGERHAGMADADFKLSVEPNPQYDADLQVHMIGFALVVGDVADAMLEVLAFFGLTILATMLALRWYLGDWNLAVLPLICSVAAVIWEFGLLRLVGFGIDPFAILVPFLVLAVSTSHGVQYVNRWADEVADGRSPGQASVAVFRRLFIPGSIALITNIAGFATIYLVPVDAVREMAIHACLGMLAVLAANKLMMPIALGWLKLGRPEAFAHRRARKMAQGDRLWQRLTLVTRPDVARVLVVTAAAVLAASLFVQRDRIIGDAQTGVPELRPDSVYNRDVRAILDNFTIGTDVLKVIAETDPDSCIRHAPLEQIDRFAWQIRNTAGVTEVVTATGVAKQIYAAMMENNPHFHVLPRNRYSLVLATTPIETSSGLLNFDCSAMPVLVFADDHRADTIDRILSAARTFNARNAAEFFATPRPATPAYCDSKTSLRRRLGQLQEDQRRTRNRLLQAGVNHQQLLVDPAFTRIGSTIDEARADLATMDLECPVQFALAAGNLGVMAATNEVVAAKELPALASVYAVVLVLLLLAYRSFTAWLVIGLPLFLVSMFANALMATLGIGLKIATLPVVTLAVGLGVDYGIYVYDVLHDKLADSTKNLQQAWFETLHETGKAVIFTGLCLAGGVAAWLFSDLQFQRDMGVLLVFMFSANMLGAVVLLPALMRLIRRRP